MFFLNTLMSLCFAWVMLVLAHTPMSFAANPEDPVSLKSLSKNLDDPLRDRFLVEMAQSYDLLLQSLQQAKVGSIYRESDDEIKSKAKEIIEAVAEVSESDFQSSEFLAQTSRDEAVVNKLKLYSTLFSILGGGAAFLDVLTYVAHHTYFPIILESNHHPIKTILLLSTSTAIGSLLGTIILNSRIKDILKNSASNFIENKNKPFWDELSRLGYTLPPTLSERVTWLSTQIEDVVTKKVRIAHCEQTLLPTPQAQAMDSEIEAQAELEAMQPARSDKKARLR